jgi:uncharacterized protein YunC (DUF1805 family)
METQGTSYISLVKQSAGLNVCGCLDVRTLRQVGDLTQFQNFLRALAARSAQLFNITDLARDLGAAVNTVKAWLSSDFQIPGFWLLRGDLDQFFSGKPEDFRFVVYPPAEDCRGFEVKNYDSPSDAPALRDEASQFILLRCPS